ncbi:S-layer homology domain-containing protein [Bacillus sp. AK031]
MKTLRLLFVLLLGAALIPMSATAEEKELHLYFPEDSWDNWAFSEIDDFMSANIIDGSVSMHEEGYPVVYVNPENQITRAQFTKMIVNALGLKPKGTPQTFSDVKTSDWFYPYVGIANSHGIITGRDGRFDPNHKINREQMAVMIHRAFKNSIAFNANGKNFTDVPAGYWAENEISQSSANGIIKGYDTLFKPRNLATRAQGIVMIHRALRQETSSLPSEQDIINMVTNHFNQERQYSIDENYTALRELYTADATGYYKTISLESLSWVEESAGTQDKVTMEPVGEFTVSAERLNNRYSSVSVDGLSYRETYYYDGEVDYTDIIDYSGTFSLKKDDGGKWKIYNYLPAE